MVRHRTVQFQVGAVNGDAQHHSYAPPESKPRTQAKFRDRVDGAGDSRSKKTRGDSGRKSFEVFPGEVMEYQLFLPKQYDSSRPMPFLVSMSGTGQQHVNGFSHRLPSEHWAVVVALRPHNAPLFFDGVGKPKDGVSYLKQLCLHLQRHYCVEGDKFLLCGVSNGGTSALRFATLFPEMCRGVIAVTGALKGFTAEQDLMRLQGLPIDMYVGTKDEVGFYQPMSELEAQLRQLGQVPPPSLTVFDGAGHCCSPLVDTNVLMGKIHMMLLRSSPVGRCLSIPPARGTLDGLGRMPAYEVAAYLQAFADKLGLPNTPTADGGLQVRQPAVDVQQQTSQARPPLMIPAARPRAVSDRTDLRPKLGRSKTERFAAPLDVADSSAADDLQFGRSNTERSAGPAHFVVDNSPQAPPIVRSKTERFVEPQHFSDSSPSEAPPIGRSNTERFVEPPQFIDSSPSEANHFSPYASEYAGRPRASYSSPYSSEHAGQPTGSYSSPYSSERTRQRTASRNRAVQFGDAVSPYAQSSQASAPIVSPRTSLRRVPVVPRIAAPALQDTTGAMTPGAPAPGVSPNNADRPAMSICRRGGPAASPRHPDRPITPSMSRRGGQASTPTVPVPPEAMVVGVAAPANRAAEVMRVGHTSAPANVPPEVVKTFSAACPARLPADAMRAARISAPAGVPVEVVRAGGASAPPRASETSAANNGSAHVEANMRRSPAASRHGGYTVPASAAPSPAANPFHLSPTAGATRNAGAVPHVALRQRPQTAAAAVH